MTRRFAGVHRGVGAREDVGGRIERTDERDPGGSADRQRRRGPAHRRCVDSRLERRRFGRGVPLAQVPEQHHEFVAADAGNDVGRAYLAQQCRRNRLEDRVTGGVAVPIVDRFEVVEIEIDERRARAVAFDVGE